MEWNEIVRENARKLTRDMKKEKFDIKIRAYRQGLLSEEEVDQLWIEFLQDEELYKQWLMEENLYRYFQQRKAELVGGAEVADDTNVVSEPRGREVMGGSEGTGSSEGTGGSEGSVVPVRRIFPLAVASAAVVVFALLLQVFQLGQNTMEDVSYLAVESLSVDYMISGVVYRSGSDTEAGSGSVAGDEDSTDVPSISVDQEIELSILMAMRGDYNTAESILDRIVDPSAEARAISDRQRAVVLYNLGIAKYNTGKFEESLSAFQTAQQSQATSSSPLLSDNQMVLLHWFQANAHLKLNRPLQATAHLTYLADGEGAIARQSSAILDRLMQTHTE